MTYNFARTKGAKDKKPRKKRGNPFAKAGKYVAREFRESEEREDLRDELLKAQINKSRSSARQEKISNALKATDLAGKLTLAAGGIYALKKGGFLRTGRKGLGLLGKLGKGSFKLGKKSREIVDDVVDKAKTPKASAKAVGEKISQKAKADTDKAYKALKTEVKKVPKAEQTVNTGKATRKAFKEGLETPVNKNSKLNKAARQLGRLRAKYEPGARKKRKKQNYSRIEFAKAKGGKRKKSVKVKGYVRSDGVKVRPSTREVLSSPPTDGAARVARISLAARPLAESLSIAANAYATLLGAQDRRRKTNRELSALGETRKFLGVSGSAGTGIGAASRGLSSLRGIKAQTELKERALAVKEANSRAYKEFNTNYGISTHNKGRITDMAVAEYERKKKRRRK